MSSKLWTSCSKSLQNLQHFYTQYKTAFTVITTLGATSAAWASYFARQKHNQKLEKDIKEINKSIAQIPEKTNQLYDRMDLLIVGGSALVIGYLSCVIKHKTVNYYRYWNAQKAATSAAKKNGLVSSNAIAQELVTKEEIKSLEKSNHSIIRYYFQSSKQEIRHFISILGSKCVECVSKLFTMGKSIIVKNKALCDSCKKISTSVSKSYHTVTNKISTVYTNCMYKYNLRSIQKKQLKALQEGEKEVINKGNMSSVITESKIN